MFFDGNDYSRDSAFCCGEEYWKANVISFLEKDKFY